MRRLMLNFICISSLMPSITIPAQYKRSPSAKVLTALFISLLVIMAAVFVGTGVKNALAPSGSHDFQWTPAKDVLDGVSPYQSFISWEDQGNELVPPHFLNQSPSYPASTYVLLSPFAHFDWHTAKTLWAVANLVFIGLLLLGMQKTFPINSPTVLTLLVLAFLIAQPLRASLGAGQHNFISLAAFIWAYYFAHNGKNKGLAGLLLSVAWIKYSLTFPLTLIFLKRGTFKPVIIASCIHALLTCIAAWRINMWPHEFFFDSVRVVLMGEGTGILNLIALSMSFDLPLPVPLTLIGIAVLAVIGILQRNPNADPTIVIAFLGLFSCAVFYHHGYDFVVLLFCAWALAQGKLQAQTKYATAALLGIAWAGQWLIRDLTGASGSYPELAANGLLIVTFYYTIFVFVRELYRPPMALKPAAVSF